LLTIYLLYYSATHFQINTDLEEMISEKLKFRKVFNEYKKFFPFKERIIFVIDAPTPEMATFVRDHIAKDIKREEKLFKSVYVPGGGDFFKKNGLLYMSIEELEELSDKLAEAQPLLFKLSEDFSIRGLFSVLGSILEHMEEMRGYEDILLPLFERLNSTIESILEETPHHYYQFSWQEIMLNNGEKSSQRRQFIVAQPIFNYKALFPAEKAIKFSKKMAENIGNTYDVKVRLTGGAVISYDDLMSVQKGTTIATILSLILIRILLSAGLGPNRLVYASIITLFVGLIWTTGFAIACIGRLNLVSITFAVLFIGLGIDFSIQFCLRYRELISEGVPNIEAIKRTSTGVGSSLMLCAITTAIGFYAFVPTSYKG
ncbi:MAG: hypothetical protein D6828_04095, partial [Nitrospirae bacterium]